MLFSNSIETRKMLLQALGENNIESSIVLHLLSIYIYIYIKERERMDFLFEYACISYKVVNDPLVLFNIEQLVRHPSGYPLLYRPLLPTPRQTFATMVSGKVCRSMALSMANNESITILPFLKPKRIIVSIYTCLLKQSDLF